MTKTILLTGQSNALGNGTGGDMTIDSAVTIWNNENNVTGESNLGDSFVTVEMGSGATDPFITSSNNLLPHFGNWIASELEEEDVKIILVTFSGNPISNWVNSAGVRQANYDRIEAVLAAASVTSLDAFLWHQGEADDTEVLAPAYEEKWDNLVANLTADGYITSSTPIVIGQVATRESYFRINPVLGQIAAKDPRVGLARLKDLPTADGVHFSGESLVIAGKRYAQALSDTETTYKSFMPTPDLTGHRLMTFDVDTKEKRLLDPVDLPYTEAEESEPAEGARTVLEADTTYYVNPSTGSDSNDGLSSGAPKETVNEVMEYLVSSVDCAGYNITIQLADGTYSFTDTSDTVTLYRLPVGCGSLVIQGNTGTPTNVDISGTKVLFRVNGIPVTIKGLQLETETTSGISCIVVENGGTLLYSDMYFAGSKRANVEVTTCGVATQTGNCSLAGTAAMNWIADTGGVVNANFTLTNTMVSNPNFTYGLATALRGGIIFGDNATWSGTLHASSVPFHQSRAGVIAADDGSYFPGGGTSTGSVV